MQFWRECQDAASEEYMTVARRLSGNEKRTKSTIWEDGRSFGIGQQLVIAGAQVRITEDVEGALQYVSLSMTGACCRELSLSELERYAKLCGRSAGPDAECLGQRGAVGFIVV